MRNQTLTKGDLQAADRVLNRIFSSLSQWQRDVANATELGLIEFEFDCSAGGAGYYIPTQKYIDLMDRFN